MSEKKSDSDWKARAKAEREQLQKEVEDKKEKLVGELPEPSFMFIVSSYVTQAYIALGEIENPSTGKKEKDIKAAKFFIDLIEVLKEKTAGNLEESEAKALEAVLAEMRLRFVQAAGS
jgi:hypothetical protein